MEMTVPNFVLLMLNGAIGKEQLRAAFWAAEIGKVSLKDGELKEAAEKALDRLEQMNAQDTETLRSRYLNS